MKAFILGLALKQRRNATGKSPIQELLYHVRHCKTNNFVSAFDLSRGGWGGILPLLGRVNHQGAGTQDVYSILVQRKGEVIGDLSTH